MSPEEERWITIILEESRKADVAERTLSPGVSRLNQTARPWRTPSRRHRQAVRVGAEYLVERSRQHGMTAL